MLKPLVPASRQAGGEDHKHVISGNLGHVLRPGLKQWGINKSNKQTNTAVESTGPAHAKPRLIPSERGKDIRVESVN